MGIFSEDTLLLNIKANKSATGNSISNDSRHGGKLSEHDVDFCYRESAQ